MTVHEHVQGRLHSLAAAVLPAIRNLAVSDDRGEALIPIGSCVLLWHRGERYLLSAAHVVEMYPDRSVHLGTATSWVEIPHPFGMMKKQGTAGDKDTIDIAYKRLEASLVEALDGCHFLTAGQVGMSDTPRFEPPTRSKYTAIGWPLNRFGFSRASQTTYPENLFYTGAIASPKEYQALGLPLATHIVIEYDKKAVIGPEGRRQSPLITGLSGGGMFRMPGLEVVGDVSVPVLAGITIQQDPKAKVMIAPRIGPIMRSIDEDTRDIAT